MLMYSSVNWFNIPSVSASRSQPKINIEKQCQMFLDVHVGLFPLRRATSIFINGF